MQPGIRFARLEKNRSESFYRTRLKVLVLKPVERKWQIIRSERQASLVCSMLRHSWKFCHSAERPQKLTEFEHVQIGFTDTNNGKCPIACDKIFNTLRLLQLYLEMEEAPRLCTPARVQCQSTKAVLVFKEFKPECRRFLLRQTLDQFPIVYLTFNNPRQVILIIQLLLAPLAKTQLSIKTWTAISEAFSQVSPFNKRIFSLGIF